ncbi:hypothetical protein [Halalkalibacter alkalisediminis]|uniref:Immunity protein 30 domain-containing protein n=1 Tax=Halalkalibacter alkalisediminis TaxID=935616 RepID=A0ABV6NKX5_9BACI|nr:hypothetical protein [Halalkalibacter alkalisediminis]
MKKDLENYILSGCFNEAKDLYKKMDFKVFYDNMLEITFDNTSIVNYSFIVNLLIEEEHAKLHDLAYLLLSQPLCHIEGAYVSAYYHAKKAAELTDYNEVGILENLLFLNSVPEKVVSDQEAQKIAKKILSLDQKNEAANELLNSR